MSALDPPFGHNRPTPRRLAPWLFVMALTGLLTVLTTAQAFDRYREFRASWPWDQAWYNQWYWALTRGDGRITVRPMAGFGMEKPTVWKIWYLTPGRFALAPLYRLFPDPRTLLVIDNVVFWLVVPAAFGLVRGETDSEALALSAAALVPLTPLLWPLAWNDFRELHLGLPFILWAVRGVRERDVRRASWGVGGMLACRQEFAVVVAILALLPPRRPEGWRRSLRWAAVLGASGVVWFLVVYPCYLVWAEGPNAPASYFRQFFGPKATPLETLATATELLAIGLGAWVVLALGAPRVAWLALPLAWSLSSGQWALRYLSTVQWHEVRYTIPVVGMGLAAGLIGYARLGNWLLSRRGGVGTLGVVWLAAALWGGLGLSDLAGRVARAPHPIARGEARAVWKWIGRVGPDDGVIADYAVTTPLSSRRWLYSYHFRENLPEDFPRLAPEIRWAFLRSGGPNPLVFLRQGFTFVHRGPGMTILHRESLSRDPPP